MGHDVHRPPQWLDAWLAAYCDPSLLEDIQGDLHELFHRRAAARGLLWARLHYGWDVLWFMRPYLRRRTPYEQARGPIMWKNYLVVALRGMRKSPLYTAINILGLAIGLAVCLLITLYVRDEVSYDHQFAAAEDTYRVSALFQTQQVHSQEAMLAYPAAELLKNDFPEVVHAVRLIGIDRAPLFSYEDRRFYEEGFYVADSNFFAVFDFPFLAGDPTTALDAPSSVVITRTVAERYFGNTNALGQTLRFDNRVDLTVTGVLEDLPHNTHFSFSVLASHGALVPLYSEDIMGSLSSWGWPSTYTYIQLVPGTDWQALQEKLPAFMDRNEAQDALSLHLQPLADIHLHSHLELEMAGNGDIREVYTFSAIALLILLIACINFMNLATARSTLRSKEVGLRKVVGAQRRQIVTQFLSQSVLITLGALALGLLLVQVTLPLFNSFVGKSLTVGYLSDPLVPLVLLAVGLVVGVAAGSYPAFYLSGARPLSVLRGSSELGLGTGRVRKGLVVLQFAISIMLIVATGVVLAQMDYARNLDLGYDKTQTVVISSLQRLGGNENYEALRNTLLQHSSITSVTYASLIPTDELFAGTGFRRPGDPPDSSLFYRVNAVGYDYFETLGIDMAAGRTFSRDFGTDLRRRPTDEAPHVQAGVILNAAGAAKAGWTPEAAIGENFIQGDDQRSITYTVVGVTEDIYFSSIHNAIEPVIYYLEPAVRSTMAIKVATGELSGTLAYIDQSWQEIVPDYPITRTFLDARFEALYREEEREATVFTAFALLAVFIACLGLLGLAAFMAERRRQEIGIRKVLGASVRDIVLMLSWDFTQLVIIANLIAWPVSFFLMRRWLADYAYSVDLGVGVFVLAGLIAFGIAWLTVGWQAGRAALTNPAHAIRNE